MTYKVELERQMGSDPEIQIHCSRGKVPRHGKPARRHNDCTIDCSDFYECEKQRVQELWGRVKWN